MIVFWAQVQEVLTRAHQRALRCHLSLKMPLSKRKVWILKCPKMENISRELPTPIHREFMMMEEDFEVSSIFPIVHK